MTPGTTIPLLSTTLLLQEINANNSKPLQPEALLPTHSLASGFPTILHGQTVKQED
jgi:hypothetical protein